MRTLMIRTVREDAPVTPSAELFDDAFDEVDDALAAHDPLALEPLSAAEIALFEDDSQRVEAGGVDEVREGAFEALRKASEAKLPFDPDAADATVEANDVHLFIHTRPARRR